MTRTSTDLLIIGFGPTGATLAGLAARRGLRVTVVDRDREIYPLPRAVQCDHEVLRILQEIGCADEIMAGSIINDGITFLTADRQTLLSATVPALAATGWPSSVFFHQPSFETVLRRTVAELGVEILLGTEATGISETAEGARVSLADGSELHARYIVGCDGARSLTRKLIGSTIDDTGFDESWLVVDLLLQHGGGDRLPTRCLQVCDPARPHTLVPMPSPRFRFEFMLHPGEDPDEIQDPETIRSMLSSWVDPEIVEIERAAVYTFHGLVASTWRSGPIFLAGDAAHQTPPFLGQGMCAGMRDAANLAWKLAAVIDGGAPDALLDSYQAERAPHAKAVIDAAVGFGQLICMTDPAAAAERDAAMLASPAADDEIPDFIPALAMGAAISDGGGRLSPQPRLSGELLDELVGHQFAVLTSTPLQPSDRDAIFWSARAKLLDAESQPELAALVGDTEAMVIRPDRYIFASGPLSEITQAARRVLDPA